MKQGRFKRFMAVTLAALMSLGTAVTGSALAADEAGDVTISGAEMTAFAGSFQAGNEASKAIDGSNSTFWHTSWSNRQELPQSITLTLNNTVNGLYQLRYQPRLDKDWNGTILDFEIETSTDGVFFETAATGVWEATKDEKTASFAPRDNVKAIRLTGFTSVGNTASDTNLYVSAAEINLVTNSAYTLDITALETAISDALEFIGNSGGKYPQSLAGLVEAAVKLKEAEYPTQEAYDSAVWSIYELLDALETKTTITGINAARMYDTNGNVIQAHGGQISYWNGTYYWYGEDKTDALKPVGIHLYTSTDLYNWDDGGVVLQTMTSMEQFDEDPYFNTLYGDLDEEARTEVYYHIDKNTAVVERPKAIYNELTDKYVIWFHADGPYRDGTGGAQSYYKAMAGVAIADAPEGPFKFLEATRLHTSDDFYNSGGYSGINASGMDNAGMARDMNLFLDDDGSGYIIYSSEENNTMYISRLNDEFTDLAVRENAVEGVDFSRNMVDQQREAPAMFKHEGKYYMVTSGCTGWRPNPAKYHVSDSPLGPWEDMGDPCVNDVNRTTFYTQSTCVFPYYEDDVIVGYIYMGDRWYNPDDGLNVGDSRYVWLPVEFGQNNQLLLREYADWTLEEAKYKMGFTLESEIVTEMVRGSDIAANLPQVLTVVMGQTRYEDTPVEWTVDTNNETAVSVPVTGRLIELGNRQIDITVHLYDENMVYFIDCYGEDENYYNGFAKLGIHLINQAADQKYNETDGWGYTSITDLENPDNYDMGYYSGSDPFGSGWWAAKNKNITYRVTLPAGKYVVQAGFQEWWNSTRNMTFAVSKVDNSSLTAIASKNLRTTSATVSDVHDLEFVLDAETLVEISIKRSDNGSDQILSWLSVSEEKTGTLIPVEGIKVDKSMINLKVGKSEQLIQTILPENATNQEVIWSSSASGTISVEDGKVTAHQSGTAVITAMTLDGEYKAVCVVIARP